MSDREWLSCSVTIKDRRTGEVVTNHKPRLSGWDPEGSHYTWSEGNYSCDCNRSRVFERAKGREPEEDETKCLYEDFPGGRRYVVLSIRLESGEEVYSEAEPENP